MKLSRESSEVEIGSAAAALPQDFKIAASKEAFAILSSGLYNNQIGAIIRELSCNAYDAHVAANKKQFPFEIHLPNRFEPYFEIEDFGVGLSEKQVYELYTTYFGTNKSDSNDFVGALGLGSKSPFSYTEGFTIVSTYNGKRTTYTCFINERGTPTVQKQMTIDHIDEDEPGFAQCLSNGVKITFPVQMKDIAEFKNNAEKMLEFFDPLPKVNEPITVVKKNYVMRTEKWGIRKHDYYSSSVVRAIQGMVVYSIGTIDQSKLSYEEQRLLQQPLDLFFDIGELSVAASRETLKNDERTINNIIKAVKDISQTFAEQIKVQLSQKKTLWEASLFLQETFQDGNPLSAFLKKKYEARFFDGEYPFGKISYSYDHALSISQLDYMDTTISKFKHNGYERSPAEKTLMFKEYEHRVDILDKVKKGENDGFYYKFQVQPSNNILFVIGDIPFGAEKFIHHLLQTYRGSLASHPGIQFRTVYLISRSRKEVTPAQVIIEARKIIKDLGSPSYVHLSNLKDLYYEELKETKEQRNRGIIVFDANHTIAKYGDGGYYEKKGWREGWSIFLDVDQTTKKLMYPKNEKKYYVKLKKGEPVDIQFDFAEEFRLFLEAVSSTKLFNYNIHKDRIYGMAENTEYLKETEKDPNWVEFTSHVFAELLKIMTPEMEMSLSLQLKTFNHTNWDDFFPIAVEELDSTSPFRQFASAITDARSITFEKAQALAKIIGEAAKLKKFELKNVEDFNQKWGEVQKRYPLLRYTSYENHWYDKNERKKATLDYIKMIDANKAFEELIEEGNKNSQLYLEAQNLDVQTQEQGEENANEEESQEEAREETSGDNNPDALRVEEVLCSSDSSVGKTICS